MSVIGFFTRQFDRDLERVGFFSIFALWSKLLACVPVLIGGLLADWLEPWVGNGGATVILCLGFACTAVLLGLFFYRWFAGYGKTGRMKSRFDQPEVRSDHG